MKKKMIIPGVLVLVVLLGIWGISSLGSFQTVFPKNSFYLILNQDAVLHTINYTYQGKGNLTEITDLTNNQPLDPAYRFLSTTKFEDQKTTTFNIHFLAESKVAFSHMKYQDGTNTKTVNIGDYHISSQAIKTFPEEQGEASVYRMENDKTGILLGLHEKTEGELVDITATNPNLSVTFTKEDKVDKTEKEIVYKVHLNILKQGYDRYTTNLCYTMKINGVNTKIYGRGELTVLANKEFEQANYFMKNGVGVAN